MSILFAIFGLALLAALGYLATLDGKFDIRRSIVIRAPAERVFGKIRDFKTWRDWSPWVMHEPDTELVFSAEYGEVDGWYSWNGQRIGAGKLTHAAFDAPHSIRQRIEFSRPFKAAHEVYWQFEPQAPEETLVTWGMRGEMPFFLRFLVARMSGMVGKDYELGLAMLRGQLDPAAAHPRIHFNGPVDCEARVCLCKRFSGTLEAMKPVMQEGFPRLLASAQEHGLALVGPAMTICHSFDEKRRFIVLDMALPIADGAAPEGYALQRLTGGRHYKVTLQGSYEFLELAWPSAFAHLGMAKLKFDKSRPCFEVYENDSCGVASTNEIVTSLYLPIR